MDKNDLRILKVGYALRPKVPVPQSGISLCPGAVIYADTEPSIGIRMADTDVDRITCFGNTVFNSGQAE